MEELRVAPSILSADYARLASEIEQVADVVPMLHVDVMDAHYVPNLTIGPPVVASLRASTPLLLDCHLMITDPIAYAPRFAAAGADSLTFHPEVVDDPVMLIDTIHELGMDAGVAVRPSQTLDLVRDLLDAIDLLLVMTVEPGFGGQAFMPEAIPTIVEAARWREANDVAFRIEVDGGITPDTVGETVAAGADTLVAGSAVFDRDDRAGAVRALLEAGEVARGGRG